MNSTLQEDHERIRREATLLAGRPEDLVQRASVYFHLFRHSGGNHVFPLLAAHGALWGSGHFAKGIAAGRVISRLSFKGHAVRDARMRRLEAFATAFKDINRRVCVETYTTYHLTRLHGDHPEIQSLVPHELSTALNACHAARRSGVHLNAADLRRLFQSFFLWEQDNVVGPGIDAAMDVLDWPVIMWIAMKPAIGFRYFRPFTRLWFRHFESKSERIEKGLRAYDLAAQSGWSKVEHALRNYGIMPESFVSDPDRHFQKIRSDYRLIDPSPSAP